MQIARNLWDYLCLDQPLCSAEYILVFGGHDLGVAERAADLYIEGVAPALLVSGGPRAVPIGSAFATEADAIVDVLVRRGVPKDVIAVERIASNTSENFWLSAELLRDLGKDPERFLVVQKPYTERRTIATALRRWPAKEVRVTSQQASFDEYCNGTIPVSRILSMLVGETVRLENYARSGLIRLDKPVPSVLLDSAYRLQDAGYDSRALSAAGIPAAAQ
jgi:hypothetical protein